MHVKKANKKKKYMNCTPSWRWRYYTEYNVSSQCKDLKYILQTASIWLAACSGTHTALVWVTRSKLTKTQLAWCLLAELSSVRWVQISIVCSVKLWFLKQNHRRTGNWLKNKSIKEAHLNFLSVFLLQWIISKIILIIKNLESIWVHELFGLQLCRQIKVCAFHWQNFMSESWLASMD